MKRHRNRTPSARKTNSNAKGAWAVDRAKTKTNRRAKRYRG